MFITTVEVYVVYVGQHFWGWSIAKSALFLAALMLCSGLSNIAMGWLTRRFVRSDRAGLLVCNALGCVACVPLFNYDLQSISAQVAVLSCGLLIVLAIAGLIRAFALSLSSKLVPTELKKRMSSWAVISMALGRGGGAVTGSVLTPNSFFPVAIGLFFMSFIVCGASYRFLRPHEKAD